MALVAGAYSISRPGGILWGALPIDDRGDHAPLACSRRSGRRAVLSRSLCGRPAHVRVDRGQRREHRRQLQPRVSLPLVQQRTDRHAVRRRDRRAGLGWLWARNYRQVGRHHRARGRLRGHQRVLWHQRCRRQRRRHCRCAARPDNQRTGRRDRNIVHAGRTSVHRAVHDLERGTPRDRPAGRRNVHHRHHRSATTEATASGPKVRSTSPSTGRASNEMAPPAYVCSTDPR